MEGNVELAYSCDQISHITCISGLAAAVEGIIVIMVAFTAFIKESLEWIFSISEVADSAEIDLQVLLHASGKVVDLLQVHLLLHLNRLHLLQLRLQVRLHLLLRPLCELHVEVGLVGEQALH